MARADTYTHLSLDRYAQILGINPMFFAGASAERFFPLNNRCNDIWLQQSWMGSDVVSREDLAREINEAEREMRNYLGWSVAPDWFVQEIREFPRHYRRDGWRRFGRNVRSERVGVKTRWGRVVSGGQRATTAVEEGATVTYSDEDGDGFAETATVTATTTLTNEFEIFAFTAGKNAAEEWRIRPARSKSISGDTITLTFWSWQMIDPDLWAAMPTNDISAIDLSGLEETPVVSTNLVDTVDIYRVYNDNTTTSVQFFWEPLPADTLLDCIIDSSGDTVAYDTQTGTLSIRNAVIGVVVPVPATYNSDDEEWEQDDYTKKRDPDFIKIYYYAGEMSNAYLDDRAYSPLSDYWAKAIAQLATARLERPLCSCGNTEALADKWQRDTAVMGETSYQTSPQDMDNPFGTRYGEILAWRKVKQERRVLRGGGAI
jgi:hypothetical protein